jgi:UDP-galactopyranose mutase
MGESVPVLILGAGPAGIGAALALEEDALLLERNVSAGGLSRSFSIGEAVFDIGGHSFHTPHPIVRELVFDTLPMYEQSRNAQCFFRGDLVPYPFQKNFAKLSNAEVVRECAAGLEQLRSSSLSRNFAEFITNRFGDGIARHFLVPYNRKLWAHDLSELDAHWVSERVAAPAGIKQEFPLQGGRRKPLQAETTVAYPAKGGFGKIFQELARRVKCCHFGSDVARLALKEKTVETTAGRRYRYDKIISTLPLPTLLRLARPVPKDLVVQASCLKATSLKCVLIAVDHPVDTDIQRIYCPHDDILAHKIAINHNSSDWLRGRRHHAVIGEISYSNQKTLDGFNLSDAMIHSLITLGVIKGSNEVLESRIIDVPLAYPVPTHERAAVIKHARRYFEDHDLHLVGRFAEWAYINADEALARGLLLGHELRSGRQLRAAA